MISFLIQYDRRSGDLVVREFAGSDGHERAIQERLRLEALDRTSDVELVVLNADSREELERTHGRYFRTVRQMVEDWTQLPAPGA